MSSPGFSPLTGGAGSPLAGAAGFPLDAQRDPDVVVPAPIVDLAAGRPVTALWRNELGGLTFRITEPAGDLIAKWNPAGNGIDLTDEIERLQWLGHRHPVPALVEVGADATSEWVVTAALPGESAVSARWVAAPATAVAALGRGLRALHDALPVDECPWDWSVEARGALAHPELGAVPATDLLVVCHGDACAPNTLLDDAGDWVAHVDLGALGVADRWADLAPALLSLGWNYGPGWEDAFLDAYGVERDEERLRFYTDLWNLPDDDRADAQRGTPERT